jgi:uncharacterized protein (DUF2141 family)
MAGALIAFSTMGGCQVSKSLLTAPQVAATQAVSSQEANAAAASSLTTSQAPPAPLAVDQASHGASRKADLLIHNVRVGSGPVRIAVFDSPNTFPDRTAASSSYQLDATSETLQHSLENLSGESFAIAVFQDLNDDKELNRGSFGIPSEPYGFSNDARGQMGPPQFDQAAVSVAELSGPLEINL